MNYTEHPECKNQLNQSTDILTYLYGGRGILTLESPSGKSHTYYFTKPNHEEDFPDDVLFVYTKCRDGKRMYVGMVDADSFRLTMHSNFLADTEVVKGAQFIVRMAHDQNLTENTPMKLYHMGVCCRCGHILTDPDSIRRGIGPKCRKKIHTPYIDSDRLTCWD